MLAVVLLRIFNVNSAASYHEEFSAAGIEFSLSGSDDFPPDSHSADLHLQKQTFDIFMCFPHDSLMTERAKTVMDDIVKSIKIK